MSKAIALQPTVTIATAYKIAVPDIAKTSSKAQQPKVSLAGTQTVTPDPAPSH